jgi:hypothetical protein
MNAGMLKEQLSRLGRLPAAIREELEVIIVDDGSPDGDAQGADIGCPLSIFKIGIDIRWNQDAARNIAAHEAEASWLLLTDMDHLVPAKTFQAILDRKLQKKHAYRFSRETLESFAIGAKKEHRTAYKPHPNSWLLERGLYERIGGYDERFAGHYGTDAEFRDRLTREAGEPEMLNEVIIRVPRSTIADASTTTYVRKGAPEDVGAIARIKAQRALDPNWRPLNLSFPYRRIYP